MNDYAQHITALLNGFRENEIRAKVFNNADEDHKFLVHCISCLEGYEKDLVESILINKVSIRRYSKKTGFSRTFIAKERDRLINLLAKFFLIRISYAAAG